MDEVRVVEVWKDLKGKGVEVDVLVLSATVAGTTPKGLEEENLVGKVRDTFETNVFAALNFVEKFVAQNSNEMKKVSCLLFFS